MLALLIFLYLVTIFPFIVIDGNLDRIFAKMQVKLYLLTFHFKKITVYQLSNDGCTIRAPYMLSQFFF